MTYHSAMELVVQFIIDHRAKGHFLPYRDYQIVEEWLRKSPGVDQLLLILSDLIPEYYADSDKTHPKSLSGMRRKVLSKLETDSP